VFDKAIESKKGPLKNWIHN